MGLLKSMNGGEQPGESRLVESDGRSAQWKLRVPFGFRVNVVREKNVKHDELEIHDNFTFPPSGWRESIFYYRSFRRHENEETRSQDVIVLRHHNAVQLKGNIANRRQFNFGKYFPSCLLFPFFLFIFIFYLFIHLEANMAHSKTSKSKCQTRKFKP